VYRIKITPSTCYTFRVHKRIESTEKMNLIFPTTGRQALIKKSRSCIPFQTTANRDVIGILPRFRRAFIRDGIEL
tara:strand:- start:682 stop:906 length:225 start_codon:yes stop_codon:yes gene_type:complete